MSRPGRVRKGAAFPMAVTGGGWLNPWFISAISPSAGYSFAAIFRHRQARAARAAGAEESVGMESIKRFVSDDTGAVTVDWVVLTSGVVILAVLVMPSIQESVVNMAIYIGETISSYAVFLQ